MTASEVYYQQAQYRRHQFPSLQGTSDTNVCVVGGGFAGLNCALGLVERGVSDVTLVDAKHIAFGASGRNGGFVFGGYSLDERALLNKVGADRARQLYGLTLRGVDLIRQRINTGIDCDYTAAGVLWTNWFTNDDMLRHKQEFLAKHFDLDWVYRSPQQVRDELGTERYAGALLERNAFHFQPYRFAQGLLARFVSLGGQVLEDTPITDCHHRGDQLRLQTPNGELTADQAVFCGGGYQAGYDYELADKIMPIATFVMVTEPLDERIDELMRQPYAVYDSRFAFDYYRPLSDGRLLWGGRIAGFDASPKRIEQLLRRDLRRVFPQLNGVAVDYVWSGLMGYTRHQMPQIGQLDQQRWYAQGFGGHGVSTSTMGGDLVARAIAEGDQDWTLFEPFGLSSVHGKVGQMAAQASYWWLQGQDWLREVVGGRPGGGVR